MKFVTIARYTISNFHNQKERELKMRIIPFGLLCMVAFALNGAASADASKTDDITEASFKCLTELAPVGDFFVDNLDGDIEATIKVARSPTGGVYPTGSVVQLVPAEAMVKRAPGFNPATRDWEFFELAVSDEGTSINTRGFAQTVNRFGGNCFACHIQARPEWDLICGKDHGCDPIPLTPVMIKAIQKTDPRCAPVELSEEEMAALKALASAMPPAES
jgi:hypothetical protein